ncbi:MULTISPECIES: C4-dicarboxylate transporter DcuC [Pelosinus]|uniref:C4-dicarboxylate anaerobic carrier-like protein n=1 Tax=Pelosinus fermentans B4 TaxID=1149862 RepID=I9L5K3_9FIRM|nr:MULTISPECIES: C4-dicarboxylate transporter DcuC [Pelosinus]EIW15644.1 C4-dicarboxylate anaerobic carrier-like protein [Pelosinus fermentans B4]EIW26666.1 anaerobic c4-dicarboxylate antiporter, DcuC family [Pelosinus fermentans A11]
MMTAVGIIVVIVTVYFLIKRYDARLVLLASGIIMACVAGTPMVSLNAFAKEMTNSGLIQAVCSVMGFAMVMKYTECDKHLINLMANGLAKVRPLLIPGVVLATYAVNVALPSAAGTAAAAGAIFVPLMMSAGVHPAMAGAAVKCGTYGSMLNPGLAHNPFVAKIAGVGVMEVIAFHFKANIASLLTATILITLIAYYKKEHKGYKAEGFEAEASFKVNILYALMPIFPIVILILGATAIVPAFKMGVPEAMVIGSLLALLVTRKNPVNLSNAFFDGMGKAYGEILGIIIAAGVFVSGLTAIGLVKAFTDSMLSNPAIVKVCAAVGPFILGLVVGSGDAATFAFNQAITPHAADFGMSVVQMGSMATLGGTLGRTMSPIAGATIIIAGIAGVNPMEIAKRNCLPMVGAMIVGMLFLLA